jgi:hypothetical protein
MAALLGLAAERLDAATPVGAAILGWRGGPGRDALALRFAGALHALVLRGRAPELAAVYPPNPIRPEALWRAVRAALDRDADFIRAVLQGPPQTNEVARSGVLLSGFLTVAAETGLPLALSEIGASAGLNLHWDRFHCVLGRASWGPRNSGVRLAPEWRGHEPPAAPVRVMDRAGCDRNPLDPGDADDRLRLLSYVWADQIERMARLRAALDIAAASPIRVERADAATWLEGRLAAPMPGRAHVVFHSIVWQYLPRGTRTRIVASIEAAGARASRQSPIAWLRLEPDRGAPGAALTLTLWPGGRPRILARGDWHGRWVEWRAPAA